MARARTLQENKRFDEANTLIQHNLTQLSSKPDLLPAWQLLAGKNAYSQGNSSDSLEKFNAIDANRLSDEQREQLNIGRGLAMLSSKDDTLRNSAVAVLTEVYESQKKRLGAESPAALATLRRLVFIRFRAGNMNESEELGRKHMAATEAIFGRNSMHYADALSTMSQIQRSRNAAAKALDLELEALAIYKAQQSETSPLTVKTYLNLGLLYQGLDNNADAERYFRLAADIAPKAWLPSDLNVMLMRTICARFLVERDQIPAAQALVRLSLADAETYPDLKEFDVYPLALVIERLGDFHTQPSAAHRAALAQSMRHILDNVVGNMTKLNTEMLVAKISKLGVEPAPADTAKAAQESETKTGGSGTKAK